MLLINRSLILSLILAVLLVPSGCNQDDPETPWNEATTTDTAINVETIAGEAATVIYGGEEQSGVVRVPENALMGVIKEGTPYLYHPALGQNVELSEETSRQALAYFILGMDGSETATNSRTAARGDPSVVTLGPGDKTTDATGLTIRRAMVKNNNKHILSVENTFNRWAGLKLPDGTEKMIPPAGRAFDANFCRWLSANEYSWLVQDVWPDEDNPYAHFASTETAQLETASVGDIHIVGATWRANPYNWLSGGSPPYLTEAQQQGKFYELVNIMDLYYVLLEGVKHIVGAAMPLECFDTAFGVFANWLEANSFKIASGDQSIRDHFYTILKEDYYNSLTNCKGVVVSVGIWEVVQTLIDLMALFDWLIEDIYLNAPFIYSLPAYGKIRLASDNPCDALADISLSLGETDIQGNKPASQWCSADLRIENTNSDRDIYIIYTRDGQTWDFRRGLVSLPDDVSAGAEVSLINAYSYTWLKDESCEENSVKAIAAIYAHDFLDTTCKDEYDYVLENDALPEGISAVSVIDTDPCTCP